MSIRRLIKPMVNINVRVIDLIEFGLQAKPSNLYVEFIALAAPRDEWLIGSLITDGFTIIIC